MGRYKVGRRETRRLNLAIDAEVFRKFEPFMKNDWQGSLSSWVEYAMECYTRENCEGCPHAEEEGQQKTGIGRIETREEVS